jgi:peptide/nickel transport system substrate-binding protein
MNKYVTLVSILSLLLLGSTIFAQQAFAAPPPINRLMQLKYVGIGGSGPESVDYSWVYDTASGEILQNVMDTLVTFNGEHLDEFLGRVATNWTGPSGGLWGYTGPIPLNGMDSGLPISGLTFTNSANQTGANAKWYYRYVFQIRQGIFFQLPYNYSLTPADIAYSFQRTLIQDRTGGPQWMLQEPLLDNPAGDDASAGGIADLTNATQIAELGALIRDSVQYNATHVWFNLMYPSPYAPFMQILSQVWSSITSKQFHINQVIGTGRPDWNGDWSNVSAWINFHAPAVSPLDEPTPIMLGCGPFQLLTLNQADSFWEMARNEGYYAGWPADYPLLGGASPAGWVDSVYNTWAFDWATAKSMYLAGDCDLVAVPQRSFIPQLYNSATPPYTPPNYPVNGTRCITPLPTLIVDAMFMTQHVDPTTPLGGVGPNGIFSETLIPADFFANIKVRKAFAYAFDYDNYTATAYLSEGIHPATAIIPGIPYYDPTVIGFSYSLALANASFNAVPGLATSGFTISVYYNAGNIARETGALLLKNRIEQLNSKYHVNAVAISWSYILGLVPFQRVPLYRMGWLADFPDAHNFATPFYASYGTFGSGQAYNNATMDALISKGIATPDGPARALIYKQIQQLAVDDCPSFTLVQSTGRHFERDWVQGWYYNSVYSGNFYYNLWKWYYLPVQLQDVSTPPAGYNEPADVNYDGKVDIKDVSAVAKSFGATYGPPIHARWVFRADMNLDRKIDIKDVSYVAKQFGKVCPGWPRVNSLIVAYLSGNPVGINGTTTKWGSVTVPSGTTLTFVETVSGVNATYPSFAIDHVDWEKSFNSGTMVLVQQGPSLSYTYTFAAPGYYVIWNDIFLTVTTPWYGAFSTSIKEIYIIIVT